MNREQMIKKFIKRLEKEYDWYISNNRVKKHCTTCKRQQPESDFTYCPFCGDKLANGDESVAQIEEAMVYAGLLEE